LAFLVDHTLDVADMMTVASAVASTLDRAAR
jgi:hypothetical protein